MKKLISLFTVIAAAASLSAETYTIDTTHSSVSYSLRHLVSKFSSNFTKVTGTVDFDASAPEKSKVEATIAVIPNTANEKRDTHLASADFFEVAKFPSASFKSTSWTKTGENTFDVAGDLTIKDVTKPVVLKTTLVGSGPGMAPGSTLVGFESTTTLKRSDFKVGPESMLKVLGDDVTVTIGIEAGHKPAK